MYHGHLAAERVQKRTQKTLIPPQVWGRGVHTILLFAFPDEDGGEGRAGEGVHTNLLLTFQKESGVTADRARHMAIFCAFWAIARGCSPFFPVRHDAQNL